MLQTVRDACQFDPKAIDYALRDQIESLEDLVGHAPGAAEAFFRKTYVTGGMCTLLRQGLQRLVGVSGQAVFELKQAMGGGKTHSMLALGYLAANPKLSKHLPKDIVEGFAPVRARVIAISGAALRLPTDVANSFSPSPVRGGTIERPPSQRGFRSGVLAPSTR